MQKTPATTQSAANVLTVLDVLLRHFAHGLTATDIAKGTGFSAPNVSRYVATLEQAGYAERIPETGRIRPSTRLAQHAVGILNDIDHAKSRLDEIQSRIITR